MLLVSVYIILLFPLIVVSFPPSVFLFRCVLHPLPLPLSSYLGCIPPLIGLPSLRFCAVASSLFLLSVCFCFCLIFLLFYLLSRRCPLRATFLFVLFCLLSLLIYDSRFDLVWFRLSCDHGWFRSGSVNVRKTTAENTLHRRKIEIVNARLLVQQFTHPVHPNSSYRLSYLEMVNARLLVQQFTHPVHPNSSYRLSYLLR